MPMHYSVFVTARKPHDTGGADSLSSMGATLDRASIPVYCPLKPTVSLSLTEITPTKPFATSPA
jgi:hypothetical protein